MKKAIALGLCLCLLLSLCGCAEESVLVQDDSPLTMYVGLGNTNFGYYDKLRDLVLEYTGIELCFVYNRTLDTTSAMFQRMKNDDCPADIVVTAMTAVEQTQKACLLDLAAYTSLPELFTSSRVKSLAHNGKVYQLPYTTRLIGIEYNKTLMEEMGFSLPSSFEDMVALKEKCDEAGILFAVSGGAATGHGFNYLFHLMGCDYLYTPDGTAWFNAFMAGEADISEFSERAEYFQRYVEAGLLGQFHENDWSTNKIAGSRRALFYYNILNDLSAYDGFRLNEDGSLYGVSRDSRGKILATEDPEGNAVAEGDSYVLYDSKNPAHAELTRYTVPGTEEIHDVYGSMPWISENGSGNCFTLYDNMFLGLNKRLGDPERKDKLDKAVRVLSFMASKEATDLFAGLYDDGFVATNDFAIDRTRLYSHYSSQVQRGFLAHWYYNDFDSASIVAVGQLCNDYIRGDTGVTLTDIMTELELRRDERLFGGGEVVMNVTETLDYKDCARLQAIAGAMSCQKKLDEAGIDVSVDAALIPYISDLSELEVGKNIGVVQEKLYQGLLYPSAIKALINGSNNAPVVITMPGVMLKALFTHGYEGFPFLCVLKSGGDIDISKTYQVAVDSHVINPVGYGNLLDAGAVITVDGVPLSGSVEEGIVLYGKHHFTISSATLDWNG